MTGSTTTDNIQSFAGTNISTYGSVINVTNGTGHTATLNLGSLTHSVGGTVVIPTTGTGVGTVTTTTTVGTTNGILGGWAIAGTGNSANRGITFGSDWATVSSTVNADGSRNIIPYTGYVAAPVIGTSTWNASAAISSNADKNLQFISTGASIFRVDTENANRTTDINTFAFQLAGASSTLQIGTGNTLRLGKSGGIFKQTTGNNQIWIGGSADVQLTGGAGDATNGVGGTSSANVGNLTAGGPTGNTPGEIVLSLNETANNNGTLNIESHIVDNGTGAVTLIKTSVSSVKIDGHNTYSGGTFINQGRFQLAGAEVGAPNPDGLGSGPVTIAPGGYLYISGVNSTAAFPILYSGPGAISGALLGTGAERPNREQHDHFWHRY